MSTKTLRYALTVKGIPAGYVHTADGGGAVGVVQEVRIGSDVFASKQIIGVKYEDIAVSCGLGMTKDFYELMKKTFSGTPARIDGSVLVINFNGSALSELDFFDTLITGVYLASAGRSF